MADDIDRAAELNETWRNSCLKDFANRAEKYKRPFVEGDHWDCEECGEDMPFERMRLGFINCVPCQEEIGRDYPSGFFRYYSLYS